MKIIILSILVIFYSCSSKILDKKEENTSISNTTDTNTEILETFVDSLNIGEKGKNKIELIKHRVFEDSYVIVKFYRKASAPNNWYIQNTYTYQCTALLDLKPNIADYNNDNFNDISFISTQAARSANEVRRLFIYDDYNKELISIINSESYPNLLYNKELNCIDAFLIHGGSSTIFAKIEGDSLKEFASVHNDSHRTIYEIDEFGKEKLIRKDKINPEDVYIRYSNFNPLKEYKN